MKYLNDRYFQLEAKVKDNQQQYDRINSELKAQIAYEVEYLDNYFTRELKLVLTLKIFCAYLPSFIPGSVKCILQWQNPSKQLWTPKHSFRLDQARL